MKLHGISCIVPCVCRFVSKFQTLGFPVGIVNTCVLLFPHAQPLVCSALAVLAWKGKVALPLVWACTLDLVVSIHNNLDLSPGLSSVRAFLFLIVHDVSFVGGGWNFDVRKFGGRNSADPAKRFSRPRTETKLPVSARPPDSWFGPKPHVWPFWKFCWFW